eukprot:Hpha_TRINITY_DN13795_c1_g1::TRINITY_DN13795_c1_g1_i1::g.142825::m.142825/K08137/galP; MFS transporter, SP family, galactose:H+ symporter
METRGWGAACLTGMVNILGGLTFGWTAIGASSAAAMLWPCMYNSDNSWKNSGLVAFINVGATMGSLGGGYVWQRLGFKKSLALGSILACTAAWSMFAYDYGQQMAARFVTGVGIGIISSTAPAYVNQMSERYFDSDDSPTGKIGGRLGCLFQVAVTFGIFLANFAGYFLLGEHRDDGSLFNDDGSGFCNEYEVSDPHWYRNQNTFLFVPGCGLSALTLLLSFIMEESPLWVQNDGYQQASDAEGKFESEVVAKEPTSTRTWILGVMGCVALQLTGINAVMFYSGKFFDAANYKHKVFGSVLVMAWNFISTLIALVLVNKFGRRGLMLRGLFLVAVSITLLTPMDEWIHNDSAKAAMCFGCLGVYILGFEMGPGCLFWVYLPELAPPGSPLFAFCNALQWVFTLIVTFVFPPLQEAVGGYVFWFFAAPALVSFVFHVFCLPETGGSDPRKAQMYAKDMLRNTSGDKAWNVLTMKNRIEAGDWILDPSPSSPTYKQPFPDEQVQLAH